MPDPNRKTVSASQIASLFNKSPYATRWMTWHWFRGVEVEQKTHSRMDMGKRMEPLLLDLAREDLRLEIKRDQSYTRRGSIGCTRDAIVNDPQRGPGTLETKCVFDYKVWMQQWAGGDRPPEHILLQCFAQMYVGDGEKSYDWGTIATWVCGEMVYFPLEANVDLFAQMSEAATNFVCDVRDDLEPDPFGLEIEVPTLKLAYPVVTRRVLEIDDEELGEQARMFDWAKDQEAFHKKLRANIKVKLLAAAVYADGLMADELRLPGAIVKIVKPEGKAAFPKVSWTADPEPGERKDYRI